jgi:hypothetical protein
MRIKMNKKVKDLTGKRFGNWTVIRYNGVRRKASGGSSGALWLCKCDCGMEKAVVSSNLIRGTSSSCGCSFRKPQV